MNKLNKKGFTLIEMLVVIAIIAVLVSIIIPVVSGSTEKAAAAANAANLRSMKAEAVTAMLTGTTTSTTNVTVTVDSNGTISVAPTAAAPKSKKCGTVAANLAPKFFVVNGDIIPCYVADTVNSAPTAKAAGTIEYFAHIAETGSVPS